MKTETIKKIFTRNNWIWTHNNWNAIETQNGCKMKWSQKQFDKPHSNRKIKKKRSTPNKNKFEWVTKDGSQNWQQIQ